MKVTTYTVSEKYNCFVWLPPRTSTNRMSWILNYFDFMSTILDSETKQIINQTNNPLTFGHELTFPPNYHTLDFICTVRHPYHQIFSAYKSTINPMKPPSIQDFEEFIYNRIIKPNLVQFLYANLFFDKSPNYIVRCENFYEDLLKIPFIKESDLNTSGVLQNFCSKRINGSFNKLNPDEFLIEPIKNLIYSHTEQSFNLFGYEK